MPETSSARKYDSNGWPEIKGNPISKVGVFPYLGKQIDGSLDPDKIYNVYRPAEELSSQETIDSFKLIPWTLIHPNKLLGAKSEGRTPAENKGIEGVIGEDVFFDGEFLRGNIKIFSDNLQEVIDSGEAEQLSAGYACKYKIQSGLFNGQVYDAIQHTIRGNHLASVPEGRMGPEVAVLDHQDTIVFTFDAKDIQMPENKEDLEKKAAADKAAKDAAEKEDAEKKEAADKAAKDAFEKEESEKKEAADKKAKDEAEEEEKKKGMDAMDAQVKSLTAQVEALKSGGVKALLGEIAKRDALASQISKFVGSFDCADKTLAEVAKYGVEKLGLTVPAGHEQIALDAYFVGRTPKCEETGFSLDSAIAEKGKSLRDLVA